MNFQRVADLFAPDGHVIPALLFSPDSPRGGALVCPGYGGTKEHMLALAAAIAEKGLVALAIDPCGHGENMAAIGPGMRDELEAGGRYLCRFGCVAAVGISLGGRFVLMSSPDFNAGISPAGGGGETTPGEGEVLQFPPPPTCV